MSTSKIPPASNAENLPLETLEELDPVPGPYSDDIEGALTFETPDRAHIAPADVPKTLRSVVACRPPGSISAPGCARYGAKPRRSSLEKRSPSLGDRGFDSLQRRVMSQQWWEHFPYKGEREQRDLKNFSTPWRASYLEDGVCMCDGAGE